MPTRPRIASALLAVICSVALGASLALAQPGDQPRGGPPQTGEPAQPGRSATTLIDVNFAGGSIGDYLNALKEAAAPEPVNVIASDDVLRLKAGPVELRGVSVETALKLLQGQVATPEPLTVNPTGGAGGSAPVYVLQSRGSPFRADAPPPTSTRVYSIRELIEPAPGTAGALAIDPETILSSIDAALSMEGDGEHREVMFHPEAAILIIRGVRDELELVQSLLSEIRGDLRDRRGQSMEAASRIHSMEERVATLQWNIEAARIELDGARRHLKQLEKLAGEGNAGQMEVEEARTKVMRAEAELQSFQETLRPAQQSLQALQGAGPAGDDRQSLLNEITRLKAEIAALRAELGRGEGGRGGGR